jgi:hypothetical protein
MVENEQQIRNGAGSKRGHVPYTVHKVVTVHIVDASIISLILIGVVKSNSSFNCI